MRWSLFLMLVVFLSLAAGRSSAQYDPNCYFPKVGEPGVIDTIYGSENNQGLSSYINIGPAPGESYGRVLFWGLPQNPPFLTAVNTGPGFDLHKLQTLGPKAFNLNYYINPNNVKFGHFHSTQYRDILYGFTMYWADENGNYDSTRKTYFNTKGPDSLFVEGSMPPYAAYLSQDSVEDILVGVDRFVPNRYFNLNLDSSYLVMFKGGTSLYNQGQIAYPDSEVNLGVFDSAKYYLERPNTAQGDWRGTGREDLIAGDYHGNLYFYRNNPPFSLRGFADAMLYDTLFARWQNPAIRYDSTSGLTLSGLSIRAFPRQSGDSSTDFFTGFPLNDARMESWFIYRGGPDFGLHRITIDSPAYLLYDPSHYDPTFSGYYFGVNAMSCGDMTGSGNPVFFEQGVPAGAQSAYNVFYVLGNALDDKIDMEFDCVPSSIYANIGMMRTSGVDTLDADGDGMTDLIIGDRAWITDNDNTKGWGDVGTVQVIHGSKKIPVHSNGRFAAAASKREIGSMEVYPNPSRGQVSISLRGFGGMEVSITMCDVLGREVYHESKRCIANGDIERIETSLLSPGSYTISADGNGVRIASRVAVIR